MKRFLLTFLCCAIASLSLLHAQPPVGFKIAMGSWEMRDNDKNKLLPTLATLRELGVRNVMITVNQRQMMPTETTYDEALFAGLIESLVYCESEGIEVTIGVHQVYWNNGSNGFFPSWMGVQGRNKGAVLEWDGSAPNPLLETHIDFLKEVIDRTKAYPAVVAYNVVNEPYYSVLAQPLRVAGTAKILKDTRAHLNDPSKLILMGMVAGNDGDHYPTAEYFMNADSSTFPAAGSEYTAYSIYHEHAQKLGINNPLGIKRSYLPGVVGLEDTFRWRTESGPYWKYYSRFSEENGGIGVADTSVLDTVTYDYESVGTSEEVGEHVWYDYDFSQQFLLDSDNDPLLERVFNWKIGRQSGSGGLYQSYLVYDGTQVSYGYPAFFGIIDMAAGIDSFESIDPDALPQAPSAQVAFEVNASTRGFSSKWSFSSGGEFSMDEDRPNGEGQSPLTSMAARASFTAKGNYMERSLDPTFYEANGVSVDSSLEFWVKTEGVSGDTKNLELIFKQDTGSGETGFRHRILAENTDWQKLSIPLSEFEAFYGPDTSLDVSALTKFRFKALAGGFVAKFDDIKFTYGDIPEIQLPTPPEPPSEAVEFATVADTYVDAGNPSDSFGDKLTIHVRDDAAAAGKSRNTFLKFDLTDFEAASVSRASVELYVGYVSDVPLPLTAWSVGNSWSESDLTFSNQPERGAEIGTGVILSEDTTASIDITNYVNERLSNGGVISVVIGDASGSGRLTRINSREAVVPPLLKLEMSNEVPDTNPPSKPEGVAGVAASTHSISLSWTESQDDVGVVGYRVFRDSEEIATTTDVGFVDSGLSPDTRYEYTIFAYDEAGNQSVASDVVEVGTAFGLLGYPSTVPSGETPGFSSSTWEPPKSSHKNDGRVDAILQVGDVVYIGSDADETWQDGEKRSGFSYLCAYDVNTGKLIESWRPMPNGRVYELKLSADGSYLWVGGKFTEIGGKSRSYLALVRALDSASDDRPAAVMEVLDLEFSGGQGVVASVWNEDETGNAWIGGSFTGVDGEVREGLAKLVRSESTGRWNLDSTFDIGDRIDVDAGAGKTGKGIVRTMVMKPDGTKLVVGGDFHLRDPEINGGHMAAFNPTTGEVMEWQHTFLYNNPDKETPGVFDVAGDDECVYYAGGYNSGNLIVCLDWNGTGPNELKPNKQNTPETFFGHWFYASDGNNQCMTLGQINGERCVIVGTHGQFVASGTSKNNAGNENYQIRRGQLYAVTTGSDGGKLLEFGAPPTLRAPDKSGNFLGPWALFYDEVSGSLHVGGDFTSVGSSVPNTHRRYARFDGPRTGDASVPPTVLAEGFAMDALVLDCNSVRLEWTEERAVAEVAVRRRVEGEISFSTLDRIAYGTRQYMDTSVPDGKAVEYQIVAINALGFAKSEIGTVQLPVCSEGSVAPLSPSISVLENKCESVRIQWDHSGASTDGYLVRRREAGGVFRTLAEVNSSIREYEDNSVERVSMYEYEVVAQGVGGNAPSESISVLTSDCPPTAAVASASLEECDTISIDWVDRADNETGYRVFRRAVGGTWDEIASLGEGESRYTDKDLPEETAFEYAVDTFNAVGSSRSNAVSIQSGRCTPYAPELALLEVTCDQVELIWADLSDNETEFLIERRSADESEFSILTELEANEVMFADSEVEDFQLYDYRVVAANSYGVAVSNEIALRTEACYLPVPGDIDVASFHIGTGIDLVEEPEDPSKPALEVEEGAQFRYNLEVEKSGIYRIRFLVSNDERRAGIAKLSWDGKYKSSIVIPPANKKWWSSEQGPRYVKAYLPIVEGKHELLIDARHRDWTLRGIEFDRVWTISAFDRFFDVGSTLVNFQFDRELRSLDGVGLFELGNGVSENDSLWRLNPIGGDEDVVIENIAYPSLGLSVDQDGSISLDSLEKIESKWSLLETELGWVLENQATGKHLFSVDGSMSFELRDTPVEEASIWQVDFNSGHQK